METLPRRLQTTGTTETTSIAWTELSSIQTIRTFVNVHFEAIIWKRSQTTETIGTIEGAIPEVITFIPVRCIPVIENKFDPDGAEAEKIIHKCSQCVSAGVWGLFKLEKVRDIKFSKSYYVCGELF